MSIFLRTRYKSRVNMDVSADEYSHNKSTTIALIEELQAFRVDSHALLALSVGKPVEIM